MFQTFSGSSRRPRQVNLSGQNSNPFAGTQKTVAIAQQERQQRQQERERINACKRIQRTWRGHRARRQVADLQRKVWDDLDTLGGHQKPDDVLTQQLQLLVTFFSSKRPDDCSRLTILSSRISGLGYDTFLGKSCIQPKLSRLASIILGVLQRFALLISYTPRHVYLGGKMLSRM